MSIQFPSHWEPTVVPDIDPDEWVEDDDEE